MPPPTASIDGYSATGCVELVHVRPTSPELAGRLLPAGYRLALGTDGQAQVIFALYGCGAFAVDGRRAPGGVVAEHAVRIEAPDGSAGRHAYLLHLVTSVMPLAAALAPLSDRIELARDAAIEVGHVNPGDPTVVRGRVQLDYASRLRPRSTGTVTVRSGGVETSGPGAYLRFDSTVRVVR